MAVYALFSLATPKLFICYQNSQSFYALPSSIFFKTRTKGIRLLQHDLCRAWVASEYQGDNNPALVSCHPVLTLLYTK